MIRVTFDETLLGAKPTRPTAPVEPPKPAGYEPPSAEDLDNKTEENQNDEAATDGDKADSDAPPNPDGDDKPDAKEEPARKTEFVEYDAALAAFEQAKVEFELATSRFADGQKALDVKIAAGKKLVDEMNQRFGDWYYVISAANLKQLQTTRAEMVTTIEVPPEVQEPELPNKPDISFPELDQ